MLLGPQGRHATVGEYAREICGGGTLLLVTSGWRERERETQQLEEWLAAPATNLELYSRAAAVRRAEPDVDDALRQLYQRLAELQRLYRRRLDHAMKAAREMQRLEGDGPLLADARKESIDALRVLDSRHLERVAATRDEFHSALADGPPELARHRMEVAEQLDGAGALVLAGGHVEALLDSLLLFNLEPALRRLPVVAWSAGAMVLTDRILLFHDRPPWGEGNAEWLSPGLGVCPGVLLLPHARTRLRLRNRDRVARLVQRSAPALCLGLEDDAAVRSAGGSLELRSVLQLQSDGSVSRRGEDDWQEAAT